MYIQKFIKGIAGDSVGGISWPEATHLLITKLGIRSNWWRGKGTISPWEVANVLTDTNLDRHLHDYANFGPTTP
jgi:hypothetical protein